MIQQIYHPVICWCSHLTIPYMLLARKSSYDLVEKNYILVLFFLPYPIITMFSYAADFKLISLLIHDFTVTEVE